jgi:hypothetical protein
VPDASCASAVSALAGSPARKSRFIQKRVIRVRGSDGLKLASELSEKGSAVIDTVSRATARVDDDDTVNNEGGIAGAAREGDAAAQTTTSRLAKPTKATTLRRANARILIQ